MNKGVINLLHVVSKINYYLAYLLFIIGIVFVVILSISEETNFIFTELPVSLDFTLENLVDETSPYNIKLKSPKLISELPILKYTLFSVIIMGSLFIYLYGSIVFFNLMKSLKESSPFTSLNAKRINIIGILFLINWLFDIVFSLLLVPHVNNIKNEYFKITPIVDVDFTYVFVGFLIMALASIFKYGIKLEEEKKLTI